MQVIIINTCIHSHIEPTIYKSVGHLVTLKYEIGTGDLALFDLHNF